LTATDLIEREQQTNTESRPAFLSTVRILLVDDEEEIRQVYSKLLQKHGFSSVRGLSDGEDALKQFEEDGNAADLIIMDYRMRRMNGDIASRKIKEINPRVKIVMVSAYDDIKEDDRALFERVLLKPISSKELCDSINRSILS
jgi:CheY-like chemotaxis protein